MHINLITGRNIRAVKGDYNVYRPEGFVPIQAVNVRNNLRTRTFPENFGTDLIWLRWMF